MARTPTQDEILAAGKALGYGDGPYPTKLRAQLAKTILHAEGLADEADAAERNDEAFIARMAGLYRGLYTGGVPSDAAGQIAAAVAPTIYRTSYKETAP